MRSRDRILVGNRLSPVAWEPTTKIGEKPARVIFDANAARLVREVDLTLEEHFQW